MHKKLLQNLRRHAYSLGVKVGLVNKHQSDQETRQLWQAHRELNARILESAVPLLESVKATHQHLGLKGNVSRRYISSVTPLFCNLDSFAALGKSFDLGFLCKRRLTQHAGRLSLSLPALLAVENVRRAVQAMEAIAENPQGGWLSTPNIRLAIEQIQQGVQAATIRGADAARFQAAFFRLLDTFKGDWYSRLHDLELVKASVLILAGSAHFAPSHRKAAVASALRHYGLSPVFWQLYAAQAGDMNEPELTQGRANWQTIEHTLRAAHRPDAGEWQVATEALAWFHERHNPDALMYARDIIFSHIKPQHQESGGDEQIMLAWLNKVSPTDTVRLKTSAIWPTYQPPASGNKNNRLELRSDIRRSAKLLENELQVVCVARNEMIMLPHFLEHYRKLGVASFILVDNNSTDGTADYLIAQPDVVLYTAETEYKHACYGVSWQQAVLGNHCLGKWTLLADADEFLTYPGWEHQPLSDFISRVAAESADAVLTLMIDMYPEGALENADFNKTRPFDSAPCHDTEPLIEWRLGSGRYSNAHSYLSALRHRLADNPPPNAFVSQKIALVKYHPAMRFSAGIHYAANVSLAKERATFAHFKYHAGFREKVLEEIRRGQHYNNAEEYKSYLTMLAKMHSSHSSVAISERSPKCPKE